MHKWRKHFPFSKPRKEQIQAINFALDAFLEGEKNFVILELGSGIGKSAIAITILNYLHELDASNNGYILVTQKILQQQYMRDFGGEPTLLKSCMSAANFTCIEYPKQACSATYRFRGLSGTKIKERYCEGCPYKKVLGEYFAAHASVTNYAFFTAESLYTYAIKKRTILIMDEAHNLENTITDFVSIRVNEKMAKKLGIKVPKPGSSIEQVYGWMYESYMPAVDSLLAKLSSDALENLENETKLARIAAKIDRLDKHSCKVARIAKVGFDPRNWIMQEANGSWTFHPIKVNDLAPEFVFRYGKLRLLMTATILDPKYFSNTLGIYKPAFLSIDSPYDASRRPIYYTPVGKMSLNKIDKTLPKLAKKVEEILDKYPQKKGIIHVVNFKIALYLAAYKWSKANKSRLLIQTPDVDRNELLARHIKTKRPTVLVSPSMTEGVDLHDSLSRFQIIAKVPFPFMGSKIIRRRMKENYRSYSYATVRTIIQAAGRSMRHSDDHVVTYILDECWKRFYASAKKNFPQSFKDALK